MPEYKYARFPVRGVSKHFSIRDLSKVPWPWQNLPEACTALHHPPLPSWTFSGLSPARHTSQHRSAGCIPMSHAGDAESEARSARQARVPAWCGVTSNSCSGCVSLPAFILLKFRATCNSKARTVKDVRRACPAVGHGCSRSGSAAVRER
jgi:hypothetical protein